MKKKKVYEEGILQPDGTYRNSKGQYHRLDGPAVIDEWCTEKWYRNGYMHRDNGPAYITRGKKIQKWFVNGRCHRLNGPAEIWYDIKSWYVKGKRHRLDGPAIVNKESGKKYYYIDNKSLTEEDFIVKTRKMKLNNLLKNGKKDEKTK